MQQLTKEQAIAFAASGEWKDFTSEEIVKLQLYQKRLCMDFGTFHGALEEVLGRPIFTHELGMNLDGIKKEFEGDGSAPTFQEILDLIPAEKLIVMEIDNAN